MNILLTQYDGMILGPIAKVLGFILQGIYSIGVHNVGLCIILFTFIVNGLIIPITIKQQKFSKMNSIITPEIQAIQAKYKGKKRPGVYAETADGDSGSLFKIWSKSYCRLSSNVDYPSIIFRIISCYL